MKQIIFIIILFYVSFLLHGQTTSIVTKTDNNCLALMKEADRFFQEGNYDKCINDLKEVLKSCNLSRNEKEHVMELLAKAYVETDDPVKAEATVNQMLIKFPHYELKETNNSEGYNRLVQKYKVHPQLSIGIRNTIHWMKFKQTRVFSILEGLDYSEPYASPNYGFFYYGWGEIGFDNDISFNGDLIFMDLRYDRNIKKAPGFDLSFWEYDNCIEIPLYLKKYFHIGKNVLPYITGGLGWIYMSKALGNAYISYTKDDIITGKNTDFSGGVINISMMEMRNRNTFEWLAGIGIGYKLKNLRLFLDVRYYGGFNSLTNPDKRLNNNMLVNDYFYVDNSVKLNQFEIGASASYTIINSVKRIKR